MGPPDRDDRDLFGVTPTDAVGVLAVLALGASAALFALGALIGGLLFFLAGALLVALFFEQALARRDTRLDRAAAGIVDRTRGLAGFAGASARAWTVAGREVTALRREAKRLSAERFWLQHALGAAAYAENEPEMAELRERLAAVDALIDECGARARLAVGEARRRTSRERLAVAQTEIRKPG